jgi:folate-binding protein YgfZ
VSNQPLAGIHSERKAEFIHRHGVAVPRTYGSVSNEYAALRNGAGIIDLGWLDVLEFVGDDHVEFLQNMIANDVSTLVEGNGCRSALLTVQGKLVGDVVALKQSDRITMLVDGHRHAEVSAHLDTFLIADDVEIIDRTQNIGVIGISGPRASDLLEAADLPVPEQMWSHLASGEIRVVRLKLTGERSWGVLAPSEMLPELWESLEQRGAVSRGAASHGAVSVGTEAFDTVRVESGLPVYGFEATEDRIPLEVGLAESISTEKGCYLGQETIIRVLHRGKVNRALFGLRFESNQIPGIPAEITIDGKNAGELTSVVQSPHTGTAIGLAVLRTRRIEPGSVVQVTHDDTTLTAHVTELPFVDAPDITDAV